MSPESDQAFIKQLSRFHPEWDVPVEAIGDFKLACEVFNESGFGNVEAHVLGDPKTSEVVAISLECQVGGKPAVYASYLAARIAYLRKDGITDPQEIKSKLEQVVQRLSTDPDLQELVMSRSLAQTARDIKGIVSAVNLHAKLGGGINDKERKELIEGYLEDDLPGIKPK